MHASHRRHRRTNCCILLTAVWCGLAAPSTVCSQTLPEQAQSLKLVPADAAFYSASLRLKEQWDIFSASKAFGRLMEIPFVQMAKMQLEFQWQSSDDETIAMLRQYVESPAGQDALALVKELAAEEIFCYGSAEVAGLLELLLEMNSVLQSAQFEAAAAGNTDLVAQRIGQWLNENSEKLNVPDVVFGFRIRDRQRATRHLDVIHARFRELLAEAPPEIAARLQREQIAGNEFLTLRLDGTLLPWEEIRSGAADLDDAEFDKWKALLAGKTVALAVGVINDFVVVSLGDSTEHLARLGQGPLLADARSFARLARHAGERIAAIGYSSEALSSKVNSPRRSMNDVADTAAGLLQQAEIGDEHRARLIEDVRGLANDLVKYLPSPGDVAAVSFLTPRGYEGYAYNFGTMPGADSSRPLAIVNHVGGNPLLFVASHAKGTIEDYDVSINWVKRIAGHVEDVIKEQAPPEEWAEYVKYRDRVVALLKRIDRANREQLIPATRDNETAIVLDVASKSVRWFTPMPPARRPLPMLEMGMVVRVSDAALFRRGMAEYVAVVQEALKLLHEAAPDEVPELSVPEPKKRDLAGGTLYSFPFPAEWGVDSQLAASAGVTETTAAASLLPAFTDRLLTPTRPTIDTSLDLSRPATMTMHVQVAKLFDALRPWVDYGFAVATGQLTADGAAGADDGQAAAIMLQAGLFLPQIHQLFDVLGTIRSYTSITYREEDAWVTHAETRIRDLE